MCMVIDVSRSHAYTGITSRDHVSSLSIVSQHKSFFSIVRDSIMANRNILNFLPAETLDQIFSLLSSSRPDVSACRLTCRAFHAISSPHLLPSVVLADNLDVLHKAQQIIEHPYFSRLVRELIYVPSHRDVVGEYKYDMAFERMDWERMKDGDKLLWQDLAKFSDYCGKGPEMVPYIDKSTFDRYWFSTPDFDDYIYSIRVNMLKELLRTLPKLRNIIMTDFRSIYTEGLVGRKHKMQIATGNYGWCSAYGNDYDVTTLMSLAGSMRGSDIKCLAVGPSLFEKSMTYWEERRGGNSFADPMAPSYHLNLAFMDDLWIDDHDEVANIMDGLHELHLPIDLRGIDRIALRETPLPSLMRIAAPSLTHLTLDVKGLIRDDTQRDDLRLISFDTFFGDLHIPRLIRLNILGWVYTQAQLQRILVRHAGSLRELTLMQNVMLEGDVVALADFGRDKLSLTGIELDWEEEMREKLEGDNVTAGSGSATSVFEQGLKGSGQSPNFALELRWLGGRSNQIVRARRFNGVATIEVGSPRPDDG